MTEIRLSEHEEIIAIETVEKIIGNNIEIALQEIPGIWLAARLNDGDKLEDKVKEYWLEKTKADMLRVKKIMLNKKEYRK